MISALVILLCLFMHKFLNSRLIIEVDLNLIIGDLRTEFSVILQEAETSDRDLFSLLKNKTFSNMWLSV